MTQRYDLVLACYLSGQMSERQWTEHLKDEHFAAWVKKKLILLIPIMPTAPSSLLKIVENLLKIVEKDA